MNMIAELSQRGLLRVAGKDALKFLQGQLTCDLTEITATQTRLGAHCNPQGRMISLFRLFWFQDAYYLQMPQNLLPIATAALKKYAVFFKVSLDDVSSDFKQMGYSGPGLKFFPIGVDEAAESSDVLIMRVQGMTPRYEIIGKEQAVNELKQQLNVSTQPETAWKCLDIQNRIPAIYPETCEKFLPHELNLPKLNGVSFKKGCYTGQEIIARMEYRGKLKKNLYRARVETPNIPLLDGDIYLQKEPIGSIVDVCQVGYNIFELLVIASCDLATAVLSLDTEQKYNLEILSSSDN
ncbi:MAG: CAF17-like 4Fe-4S cluster assembly/insertion protein YgfZ [Gammaproteobacteria bacterium]